MRVEDILATEVKNLNGTASKKCGSCGSWIEHWKKKSNQTSARCSKLSCENSPTLGGHVKKKNKNEHYIIPLCTTCNGIQDKYFKVKCNTAFITAEAC